MQVIVMAGTNVRSLPSLSSVVRFVTPAPLGVDAKPIGDFWVFSLLKCDLIPGTFYSQQANPVDCYVHTSRVTTPTIVAPPGPAAHAIDAALIDFIAQWEGFSVGGVQPPALQRPGEQRDRRIRPPDSPWAAQWAPGRSSLAQSDRGRGEAPACGRYHALRSRCRAIRPRAAHPKPVCRACFVHVQCGAGELDFFATSGRSQRGQLR